MAKNFPLQVFRGTKANLPQLVAGEPGLVTNAGAEELYIGNGAGDANLRVSLWREYGAQSVLGATSAGAPAAITLDEQRVLGRVTGGNVAALTGANLWTVLSGQAGADVAMNAKKLTGVADPADAQDAATKAYVDGVAVGLQPKDAVVAATTGNVTLADEQPIDDVSVTDGQRVLVKNQTDAKQNGIYLCVDSGAWTRAADFDAAGEIPKSFIPVASGGAANGDTLWVNTNEPEAATPGTHDITFAKLAIPAVGGVSTFVGLSDTPANFTDAGLKFVRVNSAANALEFTNTIDCGTFPEV